MHLANHSLFSLLGLYLSKTLLGVQEPSRPQAHYHKTIKPEQSATASNRICVNEMGKYANVTTEANSNKPDENPYMEPDDPNPYLGPNISK